VIPGCLKEGRDDGTVNYALCVEPARAGVLLMSHSDRTEGIYEALVDELIGDVGPPLRWENYIPTISPRLLRASNIWAFRRPPERAPLKIILWTLPANADGRVTL
jgi:hypothetical protein